MVFRPLDAAIVLVVDARPAERESRVAALERGGFLAVGASTGEQALSMAASLRVHAVVVDRTSPGLPVDDICNRLRTEPRLAGSAIIVLGAGPKDAAIPYDLYLRGPLSNDMLVEQVGRLLGSPSAMTRIDDTRHAMCRLCHHALETKDAVISVQAGLAHISCWLAQPREEFEPPADPIAVVDDNEMGRYVVTRALRAAGLNVMEAATGSAALELLGPPAPRLYLLDMLLPDIDGFEVCRSIKKARPETIVLPMTAVYRSAGHRDRALEAGAAGFLTRPIATDVIVRTISALVSAA